MASHNLTSNLTQLQKDNLAKEDKVFEKYVLVMIILAIPMLIYTLVTNKFIGWMLLAGWTVIFNIGIAVINMYFKRIFFFIVLAFKKMKCKN